jgi:hypothetical protein
MLGATSRRSLQLLFATKSPAQPASLSQDAPVNGHDGLRARDRGGSRALGHSTEYVTKRYVDKSLLPGPNVTDILPNLVGA